MAALISGSLLRLIQHVRIYLRKRHVRMRRIRVRGALVGGDGGDVGQNYRVLLLQDVPVVEGVFLRGLGRIEVAVAMLQKIKR